MKVKVKSLSGVRLFATLWTVGYQALPSMGFSRQEYWSGLPFPSPADLLDPGIKPLSLALVADSLHWATKEAPNGILLSHEKEQNWVICRDVNGPRGCHTEWSKSEREKQISYINTYIWNLEEWYWWTCLQGRNRDTDIRMDMWTWEGVVGWTGRLGGRYVNYQV